MTIDHERYSLIINISYLLDRRQPMAARTASNWRTYVNRATQNTSIWTLFAPSFLGFWLLGLGMAWIAIVPLAFLFIARRSLSEYRRSSNDTLLLLAIILALSLAVSFIRGEAQLERILGAVFAIFAWLGVWSFSQLFQRASEKNQVQLTTGLLFVIIAQGLLTVIAVIFHSSPLSRLSLPATWFTDIQQVDVWATPALASEAWFGAPVIRSNGLMGASAWTGGFAAIALILIILNYPRLRQAGLRHAFLIASICFGLVSLCFSLSRLSYALALGVIAVGLLYRLGARLLPKYGPILISVLLGVGACLALFLIDVQSILAAQNSLRPGSSKARLSSYAEGFDTFMNSDFLTKAIGYGFKPLFADQDRGVGSESTYISLLVRGGLVGVLLFVAFLLGRIIKAARAGDWPALATLLATAAHAAAADLDVGTLTVLFCLMSFRRPIPRIESTASSTGDDLTMTGK